MKIVWRSFRGARTVTHSLPAVEEILPAAVSGEE
jgi:hypothetical protein